jgi:hypothetical protein
MDRADLSRYNTLILVNGNYGSISDFATSRIKNWLRSGGNIIALKDANKWLKRNDVMNLEWVEDNGTNEEDPSYEELGRYRGAQVTGGVICQSKLDITHPLGYGYHSGELPVFVNTNNYFRMPENIYASPLVFSENPQISGYISEENLDRIGSSAGIIISKYGEGRIISFSFNPNFRAFWYGTNKLFLNAVFFGSLIDTRSTN